MDDLAPADKTNLAAPRDRLLAVLDRLEAAWLDKALHHDKVAAQPDG